MDRRLVAAVVVGAGLILAGCEYASGDLTPPTRAARGDLAPASGEELYRADCAWCHGADGAGTGRGPDLDGELDGGAYTHFMLSTGRMPIAAVDQRTDRREPAYDSTELEALVEHVVGFGGTGPAVPMVDPGRGEVATGALLYAENCAACHSTTGVGGALTSGQIAPSLQRSTPVQIAEAMLVGPGCRAGDPDCGPGDGAMPVFDDFSDHEVDSIAAYVRFLQSGGDHGGLGLGRIGPVTEGAVALLIGLGALLGLIRWIGTAVGEDT